MASIVMYRVNICKKLNPLWYIPVARLGHKSKFKGNPMLKRGSMLSRLIDNIDIKNDWKESPANTHMKGIFTKISRPTRRKTVLNNLFIENITDVLSTGSVAPEFVGRGIEISGVKISYDFTLLHVYWSVPLSKTPDVNNIESILAKRAPEIRAELISRNIMGKVPHIYFIRDTANSLLASFEEALASADLGPKDELNVIANQDFLKDMLEFKDAREAMKEKRVKEKEGKLEAEVTECNKSCAKSELVLPDISEHVTNTVPGLDYDKLMNKVMQLRKKNVSCQLSSSSANDDLFSKIEGVSLEQNKIDREDVLKKFRIERKVQMEKMKSLYKDTDCVERESESEIDVKFIPEEDYSFEKDLYEEVDVERFEDIKVR